MPASLLHAGRFRLLTIAGVLCLFGGLSCAAASRHSTTSRASFEKARHLRSELERTPENLRTRRGYERVLDAYRAIYHSNPVSPHAAASILAVGDLLADEGRVFHDTALLRAAVSQYVYLRTKYPESRDCENALLNSGRIYQRDLNDPENARSAYAQFLQIYPQSTLAAQARNELIRLGYATREALPKSEVARSETSTYPQQRPAESTAAPSESSYQSEANVNASPSPAVAEVASVTGIRYWSTPMYTRIAVDLDHEVRYEAVRVPDENKIYFDFYGARLSPALKGRTDRVTDDGFLRQIWSIQLPNNVTRVILNVSNVSDYYAFFLPNPARLIIDVRGSGRAKPTYIAGNAEPQTIPPPAPSHTANRQPNPVSTNNFGLGSETVSSSRLGTPLPPARSRQSIPAESNHTQTAYAQKEPNQIRATPQPTTAPVAQIVAKPNPVVPPPHEVAHAEVNTDTFPAVPYSTAKNSSQPDRTQKSQPAKAYATEPASADGELTMVRALGLKINRIVIDAGHGGHDSGTLGPGGIEEKNVVLDVALRLGSLLKQKLGADVIYTRDDDTFIPLETRTEIANKAKADLFISVHANSSSDPTVRGVEVYYLNFTTSADALEVAARENAVSDQSIHQLSDLVRKIALQDKINESREFAADVDQSLYDGLEAGNPDLRNRGVKKAPFVVLIGANMPSILAEISFLTNPETAQDLRQPQYRERIAEALYQGVAHYVDSLNGVRLAQVSPHNAQ